MVIFRQKSQIGSTFGSIEKEKGLKTLCLQPPNLLVLAEKERFELSVEYNPYTRLAGEKLFFQKSSE